MENLLEFKNNNFAYDINNQFIDFNLGIRKGETSSLIGPTGSGKTTLLKMICHKLPNDCVYYDNILLKDYSADVLKRKIIVVFDLPFNSKVVETELKYYLKKLNYTEQEIDNRLETIIKYFELDGLISQKIEKLNIEKKYLVKILRFLIVNPDFFAIDEIFSILNENDKKKIISYIKENEITFLNVINNLEDTKYGTRIIIMEKFVNIFEGDTLSVLKTDNIIKRLGFALPPVIDLSIELNHYGVLKKVYTKKEELVNELWK